MKKKYIGWFSMLLLFLLQGCGDPLDVSLKLSGENRGQLEKVLQHYADNPLKKKAAEFLIRNMKLRYTETCPYMDEYYRQLDSLQLDSTVTVWDMKAFYDSVYSMERFSGKEKIPDLKAVTADYLIRHIDAAFVAWQSPWAKSLPFEEFCEYILPYRVGNEPLEVWMDLYHKEYAWVKASLLQHPVEDVYYAIDSLVKGHRYFTPWYVPDLRPSSLLHIKMGSCPSYVAMGAYLYRSIGVPVACDFTPNWTNHAMGHSWLSILSEGKTCPIMPGSSVSFGNHIRRNSYRLSKAYRRLFGETGGLIQDENDVPPLFLSKRIVDVTAQYIDVVDIQVPKRFPTDMPHKYAYLSVFDLKDWKAVAYGKRSGNGYEFRDMAPNAVYLPMYYSKGEYRPAYYPVKIDERGESSFLVPDTASLIKVRLTRKFMDLFPSVWAKQARGGMFLFSKGASFFGADTVRIDSLTEYNFQDIALNKSYRYMKYIPPVMTEGNMAEIELYDAQGVKMSGKVIGNYRPQGMDARKVMESVFDGNVLSSSKKPRNQHDAWLGVDLGKERFVSRFAYLIRNDDNFIRDGELYELFYWNGEGWHSLGRKQGSRKLQYLEYDNVPANALMLLRNLTKGKEERIFTYENGRQVWW